MAIDPCPNRSSRSRPAARRPPGGSPRCSRSTGRCTARASRRDWMRAEGPVAWVPVQRGCDHRCTFCIVPYVGGPEKNRDAADVIAEVEGLAAGGVSEVTLLGQTVNSYRSGHIDFPMLLRRVARVPGI